MSNVDEALLAPLPRVRVAASLFVLYGALVLANAIFVGIGQGVPVADAAFPRPVLRFLGTALVALGLVRGARWAWWIAVILGAIWLLASAAGFLSLSLGAPLAVPESTRWVALAAVVLLSGTVALLVRASTRAAFRARAA